jgi:hypothetical protein
MRMRVAIVLCPALLASSCGLTVQQREAIDTFGEATAAVGAFCEEELVRVVEEEDCGIADIQKYQRQVRKLIDAVETLRNQE